MTDDNPLLAKVRMPGVTFRLPSQGLFYDSGELDSSVKNGEVEVYPLTAMDEIILSTQDKLLSGKAITEVFNNCIPQVLKPQQLLSRDVDYLMVCLRQVTFGPTMEVMWQHDCENAKNHEYSINLQAMIQTTRSVDPTTLQIEYSLTLENGQYVVLKPLTQENIVELMQTTAFNKTGVISEQEAEHLIVDTLASVVKSVDDITDREHIRQWVSLIPLGWKRKIEQATQKVSQWGVDFITHHTCKDCGAPVEIPVSPNPFNFFT